MIARRSLLRELVALCVVVGGLLFVWSAPALAQRMHVFSTSFGGSGSGDGQLSRPGELAVNEETGDVYVIDRGNGRVEIFSSTGSYLGQFNGSASPTGAFSFSAGALPEGSIAVDNSTDPHDPSKGDVYVLDTGHRVVDKFTASGEYIGQVVGESPASPFKEVVRIAVDPSGTLWVQVGFHGEFFDGALEGDIYKFSDAAANEYLTQILPAFPFQSATVSGLLGNSGFAFDSEENFYIGKTHELDGGGLNAPAKFTDVGEILDQELDGEETTSLGVDLSSNDVYVDHETSVAAYGPSGSFIERFGSAQMQASEGIAVDSATGTVYTSDAAGQEIDVFTSFVVPDVTTGSPSSLGETSATVGGVVDPDGLPVTSCVFEYGTSTSYGQSEPCAQAPAQIGSGSAPVTVSAQLTGLEHLTSYHFRLKVSNANGANVGQDRTLLTPEPVGISEAGVSDVSSASALFSALVNPEGADTTFHFEYGTSVSYGESVPIPDGDLGTGTSSEWATVRAQDLEPDTIYHVRVVASNVLGTVYGPDQTFTTQAGGGAFVLPDGREWELVSPPSKQGANIEPLSEGVIESAEDGSAVTYFASGPIEVNPAGNPNPLGPTQVLSRRGADGWSSEDIATPHNAAEVEGVEYRFFSPDLSQALVEPEGDTPLAPEATERTVYIRNNDSGSYVPLVTASNVPPGTRFGGEEGVNVLVGTPDLSHVLLVTEHVRLTGNAAGEYNLFEWSGGKLQLVNVLPDGTATEGATLGGHGQGKYRHAMSDDGSLVFWEDDGGNLYMRNTVTDQTVQVDAPAPGVAPPPSENSVFEAANADGSQVFFLDDQPLTPDSTLPLKSVDETPNYDDLYAENTVTGTLTDLSVDRNPGEQANVQPQVLGESEDGSVVYFVAEGVLAEGAQAGEENVYVVSESGSTWSSPRLVTVLSAEDSRHDMGGSARVSPNGRYLAFMSDASLTGYDNRDANSGQPDEEVFLYDEATAHLTCASCNPTGARPDGVLDPSGEEYGRPPLLIDRKREEWGGHWLAGSLPGWTLVSDTKANDGATYQSRYLSNEGRLFFDSADALVAQDTNGREDVYEYEPVGVGGPDGCATSGTTYVESEGGCVSLISSGTSAEESAFTDASETGDDVFFVTAARLTSRDVDTSYDMYDAHVCSTGAPCVSPPVLPPPCSSGDACKAAPSPQPVIFGAPSSATFSGAGNVAPSAPVKSASTPKKGVKKKSSHGKRKPKPRRRKGRSRGGSARVHKSLSAATRRQKEGERGL